MQVKIKIDSCLVAEKIGIEHHEMVRAMCDMVTAGTLDGEAVPTVSGGQIGYNRRFKMTIDDSIALCLHLRTNRNVTDAILGIYQRVAEARAPKVDRADLLQLNSILGGAEFIDAIKQLREGSGDAAQIAKAYGVRLVGDMLWIGTSTAYMKKASRKAGLISGQLSRLLGGVSGAARLGTKKFDGVDSKVVAVPVDHLLELLEPNE